MRCPECNRFVSYDDPPECETEAVEVIDDNTVRAEVEVRLNCGECSTSLKSVIVEGEADFDHECNDVGERVEGYADGDEQFTLIDDAPEAEGTSRVVDTIVNGKPSGNRRNMRTYYGFELTAQVRCLKCGDEFDVRVEGEEQASSFEEC